MIIGLGIIAVGVLFLLRNVGILYFDDIGQYWPVILIVVGLSKLANTHSASSVTAGLIIGGIGTLFLLRNLGYIYGDIGQYIWPGILIAVGLMILVKHLEGRDQGWNAGPPPPGVPPGPGGTRFRPVPDSPPQPQEPITCTRSAYSAARGRRLETQDFEGGKVTAVFGGAEIDLRSAGTKREEISIKAEAVFRRHRAVGARPLADHRARHGRVRRLRGQDVPRGSGRLRQGAAS